MKSGAVIKAALPRIHNLFILPSSVHGNDDSKITSLFKQGVDVDTISKELHLSKAEVEFVLKINQLR